MAADNRQGISQAVHHLVELGHRRIAHIAGRIESPDGQVRLDTYKSVMADLDLPVLEGYIEQADFTYRLGYEAALRLLSLKERPTAVIASNDEMAAGVCVAARDMGIDVPNELSIVGFDDTEVATLCYPPLTSIQQPIGEIAAAAICSVVELAAGKTDVESRCFPTRLVIRASTASPGIGAPR